MPAQSRAAHTRRHRMPKPVRVLVGMLIMALLCAGGLYALSQQAGRWGVPYFSFETDHGTTCTNTWLGHSCEQLAVADFEEWSTYQVPAGTTLSNTSYEKVNTDFTVTATLHTDAEHAEAVGEELIERFGPCQEGGFRPTELEGYTDVCIANSTLMRGTQEEPLTRQWTLATGVSEDAGTRLTLLTFGSR